MRCWLTIGLCLCGWAGLYGDVRVPAIFSDHLVLQKAGQVPVWGKADAGEKVSITLGSVTQETVTDASGKWRATLNLEQMGPGPFEMVIAGRNRLVITDVMVGEVWLASGQSNMGFQLSTDKSAPEEIPRSANPLLRQFRSERVSLPAPADDCPGQWTVAGPETSGSFSGVAYYFGQNLQKTLQVPVGVLNISWGGTNLESWTSREALEGHASFKRGSVERRKLVEEYPAKKAAYIQQMTEWLKRAGINEPGLESAASYAGIDINTADWKTVRLPGRVTENGLPETGVIWVRREVEIPAAVAAQENKMMLGIIDGFDVTYWNGEKLAETSYRKIPGDPYYRYFPIPRDKVKVGKNVVAIRLFAPARPPQFKASPGRFWVGPVPLEGEWLAKAETAFPPLDPAVAAAYPALQKTSPGWSGGEIFNGMMNPVIPYEIAGVIWYQGESNAGRAVQYGTAFPLLINDWRSRWSKPQLPFYFCQLANYMEKPAAPGESAWAELREAQNTTLSLPKTGQAVLIDVGESQDIHPRDKKTVGFRLSAIALSQHYGKAVPFSGPVYGKSVVEAGKIRVTFSHAEKGLVARPLPATYEVKSIMAQTAPLQRRSPGSELEGFAICGEDHKWVWAQAKIDGASVLVWSDQVPHPVAVRYAWADNPTCNLYNADGFPASPFRTDDFPLTTRDVEFGPGT